MIIIIFLIYNHDSMIIMLRCWHEFQIRSTHQDQKTKPRRYLIRISPREPVHCPSMYSSAFASCKKNNMISKHRTTKTRTYAHITRTSRLPGACELLRTMNIKCFYCKFCCFVLVNFLILVVNPFVKQVLLPESCFLCFLCSQG